MVLILRRLTEIKRKERGVKQSCSPVCFSCYFIFIQATFRLRSIYFGLFMLSKPVELWPFLVQTQQGTPLTALSFRFTFLLHLVRHLLMFFFSPIFFSSSETRRPPCVSLKMWAVRERERDLSESFILTHIDICHRVGLCCFCRKRAEGISVLAN